jgi:hypothetical protein
LVRLQLKRSSPQYAAQGFRTFTGRPATSLRLRVTSTRL